LSIDFDPFDLKFVIPAKAGIHIPVIDQLKISE